MRSSWLVAVALAMTFWLTSCSDDGDAAGTPSPSATTRPTSAAPSTETSSPQGTETADEVLGPRVAGVVARGLEVPWGLAFLPDGSALVTERDSARVLHVGTGGKVTEIGTVEGVDGVAEGGLLGIAVSPDYETDQRIFVYFTAGSENRVARMRYDGSTLRDQRTILDDIPAGPVHDGGRIAFGPDGFLYVGTGEAGRRDPAQDRSDLGGKILRIRPNGQPAPDNPFDGSPVWTLGHRNVQGLAWDDSGQMWASEFGQDTWDELNRIRKGRNYGWPAVEGRGGDPRYVDPVRQWDPDVASPSGIAVAGNAVWMAGLGGDRLWRIPIPGGRVGTPRAYFTDEFGRIRTVVAAPDGSLWMTTSNRDGRGSPSANDDRIIRLSLS